MGRAGQGRHRPAISASASPPRGVGIAKRGIGLRGRSRGRAIESLLESALSVRRGVNLNFFGRFRESVSRQKLILAVDCLTIGGRRRLEEGLAPDLSRGARPAEPYCAGVSVHVHRQGGKTPRKLTSIGFRKLARRHPSAHHRRRRITTDEEIQALEKTRHERRAGNGNLSEVFRALCRVREYFFTAPAGDATSCGADDPKGPPRLLPSR